MERLITKIAYGSANPRDLTAFRSSLEMLPALLYILQEMKAELLKDLAVDLDPLEDLCILVKKAIREDPPIAMKEGNLLMTVITKKLISCAAQSPMEKTGWQSLKMTSVKRPGLKI